MFFWLSFFLLKKGSSFSVGWCVSFICCWKILFKVIKNNFLIFYHETRCVGNLFCQVHAYEDMCRIFVFSVFCLWGILLWRKIFSQKLSVSMLHFHCKWKLSLLLQWLFFYCYKNPPIAFSQSSTQNQFISHHGR